MASLSELQQIGGAANQGLSIAQTAFRINVNDNLLETSGSGWTDLWNLPGANGKRFDSVSVLMQGNTNNLAGSIIYECSNDLAGTNVSSILFFIGTNSSTTNSGVTTIPSTFIQTHTLLTQNFRYIRCRIFAAFTGAVPGARAFSISYTLKSLPIALPVIVGNTPSINTLTGSNIAHSAADLGNPHKVGGKVVNVNDTTLVNGDRCDLRFTTTGAAIVSMDIHPEAVVTSAGNATNPSISTPLISAPGVGLAVYVTGFWLYNNGAINSILSVGNTAGIFVFSGILNTNGGVTTSPIAWTPKRPAKLPSNTALSFGWTGSCQYTLQYFVAPG